MLKKIRFILILFCIVSTILIMQTLTACNDSGIQSGNGEKSKKLILSKSEKQVLNSTEKFGIKLFKLLNEEDSEKNIFISPLSISTALSMAANGANGETYKEFINSLEMNDLNLEEINNANRFLIETLPKISEKTKFGIANSVWIEEQFPIETNFVETIKKYYSAESFKLDFKQPSVPDLMNKWINEKTVGMIERMIDGVDPETVLFLINALYFKGEWKNKFEEKATVSGMFETVKGERVNSLFMNQVNDFSYYADENFQIVDLPYQDSLFSMTILLPVKGFSDSFSQFNNEYWQKIKTNLSRTKVNLSMPKFSFSYDKELNEVLKKLKLVKCFNKEQAEFEKISGAVKVFVSKVKHKAFIKVDEVGTKAAAATVVELGVTSIMEQRMNLNKPFLFIIRENTTGSLLFIGKMNNPKLTANN